jgi:beta-1,4-mannosyltransferase
MLEWNAMPEHPDSDGRRTAISSLSRETMNPYLSRLYAALAEHGVPRGPDARLSARWLLDNRGDVRWLHAHWPESLYRWHRGPARVRRPLSWLKLALFSARLRLAHALGYRVVWTVHQVYPHDSREPTLDRAGARALAAAADVLIAHDELTAGLARAELGRRAPAVTVVQHGSYIGVYPPGRSRDEVRAGLGLEQRQVVLLCFGELRGDSDIEVLLDAFRAVDNPSLRLVVAGNVKAAAAGEAIERALGADQRISQLSGFVPFEEVAELYGAADVAVMPRGNGGTSGSLILALSLGMPVIAADIATYSELTGHGQAGWLFGAGSRVSLAAAITEAARSPEERARKAAAGSAAAEALDWDKSARRIAAALRSRR